VELVQFINIKNIKNNNLSSNDNFNQKVLSTLSDLYKNSNMDEVLYIIIKKLIELNQYKNLEDILNENSFLNCNYKIFSYLINFVKKNFSINDQKLFNIFN